MNKIFYYCGKEAVIDILDYRIIRSNRSEGSLEELSNHYKNSQLPVMPVKADLLMKKYQIPEGKQLGEKLRVIEKEWVNNDFKITSQQIDNIVNN